MDKHTLALASCLALAACTAGPDFVRPEAPSAKAYTAPGDDLPEARRLQLGKEVEAQWWALFTSPSLDALIRQAVASNNDLATAHHTLAEAKALGRAEAAGLLPEVSLGATVGRQKYGVALFGPAQFAIPPFTYYEVGPTLSWTPDLTGGQHRRVERAEAMAEYRLHELDAAYVSLTGQVVNTALEIAAAREEIAAIEQVVADDDKTLRLTQAAFAAGASSQLDIQAANAQLAADRTLLPPLRQRLSAARHALSVLVGQPPADWAPPDLRLDAFNLPEQLPLSLPSELVRRRPDILAAEADLHGASAAVGVAVANLYPSLTLSANLLQEALSPARLLQAGGGAWALATNVGAPLFNGGRLNAEKEAAGQAYQASAARYRQTVLAAFPQQVADVLTALAHDDDAVAAHRQALDSADATLDMTRKGYAAGSTSLLQVIDAERQLARARLGAIQASWQRYRDSAGLFVALGGSPLAP